MTSGSGHPIDPLELHLLTETEGLPRGAGCAPVKSVGGLGVDCQLREVGADDLAYWSDECLCCVAAVAASVQNGADYPTVAVHESHLSNRPPTRLEQTNQL